MKVVKTEDAVGLVLAHDITAIIPGEFKGVAFKKGHIIQEDDVETLLRIGKEHIYIMEIKENQLHEDQGAIILAQYSCGRGVYFTEPSEGKSNIFASKKGLLKINKDLLYQINELGEICFATIHGDNKIEKDQLIGGCRVIPLVIAKEKMEKAKEMLLKGGPLIEVKDFQDLKVGLVITGSEVFKGRIKDRFGPVIERKIKAFDSKVTMKTIVPDELEYIKNAILDFKDKGAQLIIVTGGMSVDPDDKTPGAIKETGADIITYGTPVLPGSMLMMAYLDDVPVLGLPGCVMFSHTTVFDLLLPRIFAGEKINRKDILGFCYGGQCLKCSVCNFPNCHFGKGM
ncbi:molybdenum cofactor synthesis domain-containing protein [Anaerobranca californiensis DSM 14826]|uniref:Molybdopterin molybdenumtransferase n=1 Tax=Anaerobranca californiensis DSM 14826 TaxID=1120989 RepID=A0A1M6LKR1_9FIRM|nr:molybdopterin-binding protein [Anaerobranca californiensis]SHJ71774.1 molybdenum cofactor synthesis domain-containing protein [Anaerobranca californiensis DSM 14826]